MTPTRRVAGQVKLYDPTERQFLADVREAAKWLGWLTYHTHRSDRSEPGFPDLVMVKTLPWPRLVFAELKVGRNRPTQSQEVWGVKLSAVPGVEHYFWTPEDRPAIREVLER